MSRAVTPQDRDLVELLRKELVPLYYQALLAKGVDRSSAARMANRRFENELRNGQLKTATAEELTEQQKLTVPQRIRNLRTSLALKLLAPKKGGAR